MKQLVVIVIIAHKSVLSDSEKASLRQCYKVLGSHPIRLICPEGLDVSIYYEINPDAKIIFIDPKWQSDYRMFNELKMSLFFYEMFRQYKFILFYELDAWVFRDELEYWCEKGYDYIGAPWFDGYGLPTSKTVIGVGNGGFSLRNVPKAIRMLQRIKKMRVLRKFWYRSKVQTLIRFEKMITWPITSFKIKSIEQLHYVIFPELFNYNEDYYWCRNINYLFIDFNIPPKEEAVKFSMEAYPSMLFHNNGKHLPFGCHAWEKYEPEFWKEFINVVD